MANTYYDSNLAGEQIEQALEAIDGVIVPANNGKVLAINNGKIEARSVQWGGGAVVQPLSVTQNGTYNPPSGVDGYAPVTVNVSGGGGIVYVPYNPEYEQGAVNGDRQSYSSNKVSSTTRIRPVDIVDVSQFLNDKVLFVWDESLFDITIQQYDANGIAQVYSNPWYTTSSIDTISQPNIVIPIRKKSVGDIIPSDYQSVNLKLVSLTDSVF